MLRLCIDFVLSEAKATRFHPDRKSHSATWAAACVQPVTPMKCHHYGVLPASKHD